MDHLQPLSVSPSSSVSSNSVEKVFQINKCARFFKTLLSLANNQEEPRKTEVKQTVKDILCGYMTPEEFASRLQAALNSQTQRNLLPFLKDNLALLINALTLNDDDSSHTEIFALKAVLKEEGLIFQRRQTTHTHHIPHHSATTLVNRQQYGSNSVHPHVGVQNGGTHQNKLLNHSMKSTMSMVKKPDVMNESDDNIMPNGGNNFSALDASIEGVVKNFNTPISEGTSHSQSCDNSQQYLPRPISKENPQQQQQSQPQIRLVNWDPDRANRMLINPNVLIGRIREKMPETDVIDQEMLSLVSEAAETRLRTIVSFLSIMAEHRLEPLRINPAYKQTDDPRRQLRFVEDIEKNAHAKREASEKEALLRLTKSKGKDKDTREKVKEIQRADREATANRETNAAAFAALGGMRIGAKRNAPDGNLQNGVLGSTGAGTQNNRPRAKRITMRDLQYVVNHNRVLNFSPSIKHRVVLASLNIDDSNPNLQK